MKVHAFCCHCRKEFMIDENQLKYPGYGKYCSRHCHYASRKLAPHKDIVTESRVKVFAPDNPMANKDGRVYRYRLEMAKMAGRPLLPNEIVHHENEIKSDDYQENLELTDRAAHQLKHATKRALQEGFDLKTQKRCPSCGKIKQRSEYSPTTSRGRKTVASQCRKCAAAWQRNYRKRRILNRKRKGK